MALPCYTCVHGCVGACMCMAVPASAGVNYALRMPARFCMCVCACVCVCVTQGRLSFTVDPSTLLTYQLTGPINNVPEITTRCMALNSEALALLQDCDYLEITGWDMTWNVLRNFKSPKPKKAIRIRETNSWQYKEISEVSLAWRFGEKLPCSPHIDWVIDEGCGTSKVADLILSRGVKADAATAGTVYVLTASDAFETAVAKLVAPGATRFSQLQKVQRRLHAPEYTGRSLTALNERETAALHGQQLARCQQLHSEGTAVAAALTAAATAARNAGRAEDATEVDSMQLDAASAARAARREETAARLDAAAADAGAKAAQAEQMVQKLTRHQYPPYPYPHDQVPAADTIAKVWEDVRTLVLP